MRLRKGIVVFLYLCMILGCLGIVIFLGRLTGKPGGGEGHMESELAAETPSDAGINRGDEGREQDGKDNDDNRDENEEEERLREEYLRRERDRLEREKRARREWLERYRRWYLENSGGDGEEQEAEEVYMPPELMIASDLHYMSSETHDDGEAFQRMIASDDGKISQYSDEIVDALMEEAVRTRPSALVLAGDITLNGERINHEKLAEKLQRVQDAGVQVLVIPGNHDIMNDGAATYFGNVREPADFLRSGQEFRDIYHAFGPDQAISCDEHSLSYTYALDESHWMMMIDSCQYDDRNHVNGRIKEGTLRWMREQLDAAREQNAMVVPVAHHNLLSESRMYTTECTLENYQEVLRLLEEYEVPLYISGHLHAQRIKKYKSMPGVPDDAYGITEIVLSPYSIPPCQYGYLAWDDGDNMTFETRNEEKEGTVELAKKLIGDQAKAVIGSVPEDLKEEMAGLYAELYLDYCNGNRTHWSEVRATRAYKLWERVEPDNVYMRRMGEMVEDLRNNLRDWNGGGRTQLTGPGDGEAAGEPGDEEAAGKPGPEGSQAPGQ